MTLGILITWHLNLKWSPLFLGGAFASYHIKINYQLISKEWVHTKIKYSTYAPARTELLLVLYMDMCE